MWLPASIVVTREWAEAAVWDLPQLAGVRLPGPRGNSGASVPQLAAAPPQPPSYPLLPFVPVPQPRAFRRRQASPIRRLFGAGFRLLAFQPLGVHVPHRRCPVCHGRFRRLDSGAPAKCPNDDRLSGRKHRATRPPDRRGAVPGECVLLVDANVPYAWNSGHGSDQPGNEIRNPWVKGRRRARRCAGARAAHLSWSLLAPLPRPVNAGARCFDVSGVTI